MSSIVQNAPAKTKVNGGKGKAGVAERMIGTASVRPPLHTPRYVQTMSPLTEDAINRRIDGLLAAAHVTNEAVKRNLFVCGRCTVNHRCDVAMVDPLWRRLAAGYRPHTYSAGETIQHAGTKATTVSVVCTGEAELFRNTGTGDLNSTMRVAKLGNMIHDIDFLAGNIQSRQGGRNWGEGTTYEESIALKPETTIAHFEKEIFMELLKRSPRLMEKKLTQMARAARDRGKRITSIAYSRASSRLVEALWILTGMKERHRIEMLEGKKPAEFRLDRRRKDIAAMAHLTIETTVRLLAKAEKEGLLRRVNDHILLLRPFFEKEVPRVHLRHR